MNTPLRLLAIDIGAESGRAVVGSFDGQRLSLDEAHRFPNAPVHLGGTLYWDFLRLFGDLQAAMRKAGSVAAVGIDTWGVDFGLIDNRGRLLSNPVHYRDLRTAGMLDLAVQRVPRAEIYAATGIQFMQINTLYQLLALTEARDAELERAERLLLMPDLFNHFLCGSQVSEYTNATTTQCLDARSKAWSHELLACLGIPGRIMPEIVPPGTVLGAETESGVRVIATATHDTAAAVAAMPLQPATAYVSSGTWSLVGLEVQQPVISEQALAANMTNEGGVAGTIRFLRNVMGLWLVQEARRALGRGGDPPSYEQLTAMADRAPPFTAFVDPDDDRFLRPGDLPGAVAAFCRETGQPVPEEPGTLVRVLLESLALKYAWVVDRLAALTGRALESVYVVGGGARNELLCRLTAAATGLPVRAGSVEATAIGNLIVQAIALGELASLTEARDLVAHSFPATEYEPHGDWSVPRRRFEQLLHTEALHP